ncbi:MAG: O-antigen ligase family protein [Polaromonas sp.]|nr:O-antigen ligase family protein [Polaromonas sp.]
MAKKKRISNKPGNAAGQGISGGSGNAGNSGSNSNNGNGDSPGNGNRASSSDAGDSSRNGSAASSPRAKAQPSPASTMLPTEIERGDWTVAILAFMVFLTPAVGVPNEEMLQDTLKSIVVSFAAVIAGLLFFWQQRNRREGLRWHALMWLPIALMLYALGSMVWSHTFLGGVEAIRWFIFSLLLWLGMNTLSRARIPYLLEGIHWGAVVASLWAALQFWIDFTYFPQGPNPASTFVNRNFFAEFVVCTIPFSAYLLAQSRGSARITVMAFTLGFNIVALLMTGTRGALSAMWLSLGVILPVIAVLYRKQFAFSSWDSGKRILACGVLIASVIGMGLVNTSNPKLLADSGALGTNAFNRASKRTASIGPGDFSLNVRFLMWNATGRIIKAKPWTGIGAGAWEAMLPLYQNEGSQLETDYYVHNEVLQLLAEYGLTGLLFLLSLTGYLLYSAWKTFRDRSAEALVEAPVRAIALSSLLAFLIVSNIGFPWRLAATGAMFALSLALLAASDARLQKRSPFLAIRLSWKPVYSQMVAVFLMVCLALTAYISQQAAATEQKIVRAVKMALGVTQSGDYNNPKWDKVKKEMLTLVGDGVAINPHYRKITPMVADELARWGDWKNAVWVWESVVSSRPYIVAIMSNIARGYAQTGQTDKALEWLERCEKLQPKATSVRSLKVILYSRNGREPEAAKLAKQSIEDNLYDYDLLSAAYVLGMRNGDYDMAIKGMEIRSAGWAANKSDGLVKAGNLYASQKKDEVKALAAFKAAIAASATDGEKEAIRKQIPPVYLAKL